MIPVLSREQMRAFDAHAIERARVPGLILMENAGRGAADVIEREALGGRARDRRAVVVCGTGNNGGDGFVVARHLRARGAHASVFLAGDPARISGDARAQHDAWVGIGGSVVALGVGDDLGALREATAAADVVVDALFGTGLDRAIAGLAAEVIAVVNEARAPRAALDIPSGVNADTGVPMGVAVSAQLTVTFAHLKLGLVTPGGADHAGRVHVADIGVPSELPDGMSAAAELLEPRDVAAWLSPRTRASHKGSAGHVAVLAGSPGKVGAALLVARGALRAGAGVATIASRPEAISAMQLHAIEVMTASLDPGDVAGSVDAALEGKRAVVVGPGFGLDGVAKAFVARVIEVWSGLTVVDADALTHFAGRAEALAAAKGALVLTPHPGEAGRLLSIPTAAVQADRFAAARELAARAQAVVVLKGAYTLIADPLGRVVVSGSGTPALATAGSGDTLCGIIAAQGCALGAFEAACAGVYLHGAAAEAWSARHGDRGLLASELGDHVPAVISRLAAENK